MKKTNNDEALKKFFIKQIKTTKDIIYTFSDIEEFSPTMLLNSLLSLVVLPYEKAKNKDGERIFKGKYKDLEKKLGIVPLIFQPIKKCTEEKITYNNKTVYCFINKFRNGIAHQNIIMSVDYDKRLWITIYNIYSSHECKKCKDKKCGEKGLKNENSGIVDFKITVTVSQLQKIAIYIADSYLNAIKDNAIITSR